MADRYQCFRGVYCRLLQGEREREKKRSIILWIWRWEDLKWGHEQTNRNRWACKERYVQSNRTTVYMDGTKFSENYESATCTKM
ncbi:hypothetical protein B7P43_G13845 [Cryptotermes secundus]|uniref:Uncharacterized protein n=1 Tax=Cryptotermes secundus TaxID=105785 RepID=A0A2J7R6Y9_9NEOP|nr:hypothetical protein B7P43_G13845 [Cryptotermes secundus]